MQFVFGNISEVDAENGKYRVDLDAFGIVTDWLPRIELNTKENKDESPFDVKEHVVCVMDKHLEEGFILGAIYNDNNKPVVGNKDKRRSTFKDGSFMEFDRSSGDYEVNVKGKVNIVAQGEVTVNGQVIKLNGDSNNGLVKAAVVKEKLNVLEEDDNKIKAVVTALAGDTSGVPLLGPSLAGLFTAAGFLTTPIVPTTEPELRNDDVKH